jgi:hypothetical protein
MHELNPIHAQLATPYTFTSLISSCSAPELRFDVPLSTPPPLLLLLLLLQVISWQQSS